MNFYESLSLLRLLNPLRSVSIKSNLTPR